MVTCERWFRGGRNPVYQGLFPRAFPLLYLVFPSGGQALFLAALTINELDGASSRGVLCRLALVVFLQAPGDITSIAGVIGTVATTQYIDVISQFGSSEKAFRRTPFAQDAMRFCSKSVKTRTGLQLTSPGKPFFPGRVVWWSRWDLNPRPLPCEGSALPLSYGPICAGLFYQTHMRPCMNATA